MSESAKLPELGVKAAAAYYPSHDDLKSVKATVPLLILSGEADDVTPAAELRLMLSASSGPIEAVEYPAAMHGFDIASLSKPRTIRIIPLLGPSATLGFDQAAAASAREKLIGFLDRCVVPQPIPR